MPGAPGVTPLPATVEPQDDVEPGQDDPDAPVPKPGIAAAGNGTDESDDAEAAVGESTAEAGGPTSEGPADDTMGADR